MLHAQQRHIFDLQPEEGAKDDKSTHAELKQHQQFLKDKLREYGKGLITPLFDLVAGHSK